MEDILSRNGVHRNRSTLYDWMAALAEVTRPLYDLMMPQVLQSCLIQMDDSAVKLIVPLACRGFRATRFWAYLDAESQPFELYGFTVSRKRQGPEECLRDYCGYLQADAYGGYDGICLQSQGRITEVACWAHCRRYWYKACKEDSASAHHALTIISRRNDVERPRGSGMRLPSSCSLQNTHVRC